MSSTTVRKRTIESAPTSPNARADVVADDERHDGDEQRQQHQRGGQRAQVLAAAAEGEPVEGRRRSGRTARAMAMRATMTLDRRDGVPVVGGEPEPFGHEGSFLRPHSRGGQADDSMATGCRTDRVDRMECKVQSAECRIDTASGWQCSALRHSALCTLRIVSRSLLREVGAWAESSLRRRWSATCASGCCGRRRTPRPSTPPSCAVKLDELRRRTPAPVLWLFGKTQSGKTSLVKFLTGATDAEVGNGFRPCTRTSRRFPFPTPDDPVLTFLDTRGVDEPGYDAAEDLAAFDAARAPGARQRSGSRTSPPAPCAPASPRVRRARARPARSCCC